MSRDPLVIAIDSSTTSTKALVVDMRGEVLGAGRADIALLTPGPDRYEHDPEQWWSSTRDAIAQAVAALPADRRADIQALGMTAQRQSFALFRDDATALRPGILWLDGRATAEVARLGSEHVHELSGFQPDVTPSFYKIAWLGAHESDLLRSADKIATVHGYLVRRLTGEWVDSAACADSLGLFNMAALEFSAELLELAGLRESQLPRLVAPGAVCGELTVDVARELGLPRPIPVIAGCGDGQAAGLGCGATAPDQAYLNLGTAIVAGAHSPRYSTGATYRTDAAGIAGSYVLEVVQNSGAYLASWFRAELGDPSLAGRPDPELDAAAAAVAAGCGGLLALPYWNAVQSPHWDPLARGAFVGLNGAHTRASMYRALLEGMSMELARNIAGLQRDTGVALTSVRVMGGGQRSPLWRQIMTDAVGLPLQACLTDEVSALGAGVLAMASTGAYPDLASTAAAMARVGDVTQPDPERHALYAELGAIQAELYPALAPVFKRQARFAEAHPWSTQA